MTVKVFGGGDDELVNTGFGGGAKTPAAGVSSPDRELLYS